MIKIVKLEKSCPACPAQWEGKDAQGNPILIRYRWGCLTVRKGPDGGGIFRKQLGGDWDGCLSLDELKKATKGILEFPAQNGDKKGGRNGQQKESQKSV